MAMLLGGKGGFWNFGKSTLEPLSFLTSRGMCAWKNPCFESPRVNATCSVDPGAPIVGPMVCTCPLGFSGDGLKDGSGCADIDECAAGVVEGGFGAGVLGGSLAIRKTVCTGPGEMCQNLFGSYTCDCAQGYQTRPDGKPGCVDKNECLIANPCLGAKSFCVNLPGSFECVCSDPSHRPDPLTGNCRPFNACIEELGAHNPCDVNLSDCAFDEQKGVRCECKPGFRSTSQSSSRSDLEPDSRSVSSESQFSSPAATSASFGEVNRCVDVDECQQENLCPPLISKCVNLPGTYRCECDESLGFTQHVSDPNYSCQNLNECEAWPNACGDLGCCQDLIPPSNPPREGAGYRCAPYLKPPQPLEEGPPYSGEPQGGDWGFDVASSTAPERSRASHIPYRAPPRIPPPPTYQAAVYRPRAYANLYPPASTPTMPTEEADKNTSPAFSKRENPPPNYRGPPTPFDMSFENLYAAYGELSNPFSEDIGRAGGPQGRSQGSPQTSAVAVVFKATDVPSEIQMPARQRPWSLARSMPFGPSSNAVLPKEPLAVDRPRDVPGRGDPEGVSSMSVSKAGAIEEGESGAENSGEKPGANTAARDDPANEQREEPENADKVENDVIGDNLNQLEEATRKTGEQTKPLGSRRLSATGGTPASSYSSGSPYSPTYNTEAEALLARSIPAAFRSDFVGGTIKTLARLGARECPPGFVDMVVLEREQTLKNAAQLTRNAFKIPARLDPKSIGAGLSQNAKIVTQEVNNWLTTLAKGPVLTTSLIRNLTALFTTTPSTMTVQ